MILFLLKKLKIERITMNTNKINIFNDDCIEVLKNLPENSVDLVVTDPPYIVKTEGGGGWSLWL